MEIKIADIIEILQEAIESKRLTNLEIEQYREQLEEIIDNMMIQTENTYTCTCTICDECKEEIKQAYECEHFREVIKRINGYKEDLINEQD
ncbi:hypothetical protein [Tortoise microvirus 20]|nr:hypothetical protein [Tortoise microvirus 20]